MLNLSKNHLFYKFRTGNCSLPRLKSRPFSGPRLRVLGSSKHISSFPETDIHLPGGHRPGIHGTDKYPCLREPEGSNNGASLGHPSCLMFRLLSLAPTSLWGGRGTLQKKHHPRLAPKLCIHLFCLPSLARHDQAENLTLQLACLLTHACHSFIPATVPCGSAAGNTLQWGHCSIPQFPSAGCLPPDLG